MQTENLLNELESRAIRVSLHQGGLRATGKTENLTAGLKAELALLKFDLMARLGAAEASPVTVKDQLLQAVGSAVLGADLEAVMEQAQAAYEHEHLSCEDVEELAHSASERSRQIPHSVEDMPLSEFAESGLVREVTSRMLGEVVLFAADNGEIPADNSLVVYRASELRAMVGVSPDALRAAHAVKKKLEGELVEVLGDGIEIPVERLSEWNC